MKKTIYLFMILISIFMIGLSPVNARDVEGTTTEINSDSTTETDSAACQDQDIGNVVYLVKKLVGIMEIAAPVIVIILGSVDFLKATMAKDEQEMDKDKKRFVNRLILAVIIFLIFAVFQLITNILVAADVDHSNAWLSCWNNATWTPTSTNGQANVNKSATSITTEGCYSDYAIDFDAKESDYNKYKSSGYYTESSSQIAVSSNNEYKCSVEGHVLSKSLPNSCDSYKYNITCNPNSNGEYKCHITPCDK